jgi:divalent metal cation (Fe/Co/Zn/Cd) transporter
MNIEQCRWSMTTQAQAEILLADRSALIREAFRIEYLTVGWMVIEAAVAIASAFKAGSLTLLAFGFDSLIEIASATVLLWRLSVELRHGQSFAESAERRAAQIGGALLFALALYVVAAAGWKLWTQQGAEFSFLGLVVSSLALPIMYLLARRKLRLAEALESRALRADAIESITCGWLSLVVVAALAAQLIVGAWWVDAVASLGIVWLLVREGREAWRGEECCEHDCP